MQLLLLATVGQGILQSKEIQGGTVPIGGLRSGSIEVWQDDFFNTSKIDQTLSSNIEINTTIGTVSMQNTYPAWIDPTYTRMKTIVVHNNGQETFHDYDVDLMVQYDSNMQPDFDDLRFTDPTGAQLPYYFFNIVNVEIPKSAIPITE
jgi:hypothetical protein